MFQSFDSSSVWRSLPLPPPSAMWPLRPAQGGPRGRLLGGVKRPVSPVLPGLLASQRGLGHLQQADSTMSPVP